MCEACLSQARAQLNEGYPVRMPLLAARPGEPCGQFPQDFPMFAEALMRVQFDSPYPYEQVLLQDAQAHDAHGRLRAGHAAADHARGRHGTEAGAHGRARAASVGVTDSRNGQSLEMVERLKMENVEARLVDPWPAAA